MRLIKYGTWHHLRPVLQTKEWRRSTNDERSKNNNIDLNSLPTETGLILMPASLWASSALSEIFLGRTPESQRVLTKVVRPVPEAPMAYKFQYTNSIRFHKLANNTHQLPWKWIGIPFSRSFYDRLVSVECDDDMPSGIISQILGLISWTRIVQRDISWMCVDEAYVCHFENVSCLDGGRRRRSYWWCQEFQRYTRYSNQPIKIKPRSLGSSAYMWRHEDW